MPPLLREGAPHRWLARHIQPALRAFIDCLLDRKE
jgi:hypothetical protein